jgi:NAD(P)H-dependent FMN reductase
MSDLSIGIIVGSTRPGRKGDQVGNWVLEQAAGREGVTYELLDLAEFALPQLDEALPPSMGQYANEHTKAWSSAVNRQDGFVIITPEYNHSTSGALKTALDFLYSEWNNKSAGFVSYGYSSSGTRAVEHLRSIIAELQIAGVRQQVALSLANDFEGHTTLKAGSHHEKQLGTLFDQVESWSRALKTVRTEEVHAAA